MPGFNRRGPEGEGPMTGRGLGRCNENANRREDDRDFDERGTGRRWRFRFGGDRGFGSGRGFGRRGRS